MKTQLLHIVMEVPGWGVVTTEALLASAAILGLAATLASAYALSRRVKQP